MLKAGTMMFRLVLAMSMAAITAAVVNRCFECREIPKPSDCSVVVACPEDEVCMMQQYITSGGLVLYSSGCQSKQRCIVNKRTSSRSKLSSLIKREDIIVCEECCDGEFCNMEGCGITAPKQPERGPLCFSCPITYTTDSCRDITVCDHELLCSIREKISIVGPSRPNTFETTCLTPATCAQLNTVKKRYNTRAACCKGDFCNDKFSFSPATTSPPASTMMSSTPAPSITVSTMMSSTPAPSITLASTTQSASTMISLTSASSKTMMSSTTSLLTTMPSSSIQLTATTNLEATISTTNAPTVKITQPIASSTVGSTVNETSKTTVQTTDSTVEKTATPTHLPTTTEALTKQETSQTTVQTTDSTVEKTATSTRLPTTTEALTKQDTSKTTVQTTDSTTEKTTTSTHLPTTTEALSSHDRCVRNHHGYKYDHHSNLCYRYYGDISTWKEANRTCASHGADMAILDTKEKWQFMKDKLAHNYRPGHNVYIGARGFHNNFRWPNGERITFTAWASNQPDSSHEDCVYINKNELKWHDQTCTHEWVFICTARV